MKLKKQLNKKLKTIKRGPWDSIEYLEDKELSVVNFKDDLKNLIKFYQLTNDLESVKICTKMFAKLSCL